MSVTLGGAAETTCGDIANRINADKPVAAAAMHVVNA